MKRIAVFLAVQLIDAGIAWVGGFNFDQRGVWVVYGVLSSVVVGLIACAHPDLRKDTHDH